MNKATDTFTVDQANKMIGSVASLLDSIGNHANENNNRPASKSNAATEHLEFSKPELVLAAYSQAEGLIEVAGDHLYALNRVLTEPVQTIAPWNCARAVLETSAISAWLLDPTLDAKARVSRSFAFRYEGLDQQLKFAKAWGEKSIIDVVEKRTMEVEDKALSLGFKRITNKNGKRIGIAERMPGNTEIVRDVLNEELNYRLLSAMTHAHHWAYQELGFQVIHEGEHTFIEKNLEPIWVAHLCSITVKAFLEPVRRRVQLYGWDPDCLEEAIKPDSEVLSVHVKILP